MSVPHTHSHPLAFLLPMTGTIGQAESFHRNLANKAILFLFQLCSGEMFNPLSGEGDL